MKKNDEDCKLVYHSRYFVNACAKERNYSTQSIEIKIGQNGIGLSKGQE